MRNNNNVQPASRPLAAAAAALVGGALLAGCGTYVEPKPGVYLGLGKSQDLTCIYEAPTANLIASWRCRTNEAASASADTARETIDRVQPLQPRDP